MGTFQNCSLLFINRGHDFSELWWRPNYKHWCQDCGDQQRKDHSTNESENFILKIFVDAWKFLLFFFSTFPITIFTQGYLRVLLCPEKLAVRMWWGRQCSDATFNSTNYMWQMCNSANISPVVPFLTVSTYTNSKQPQTKSTSPFHLWQLPGVYHLNPKAVGDLTLEVSSQNTELYVVVSHQQR